MKKLGLIGGIGPESTVAYYRKIIHGVQEKPDGKTCRACPSKASVRSPSSIFAGQSSSISWLNTCWAHCAAWPPEVQTLPP